MCLVSNACGQLNGGKIYARAHHLVDPSSDPHEQSATNDVEGAEAGTQIHAKDIALPQGVTLVLDADTLVVNVTAAPTAAQVEAELESAEAEAGIVHEASEAETEAAAATEAE